jgi:hypothetical protein
MRIFGIDIAVIILAVITGLIGYQLNIRSKTKENFLKELNNSYINLYHPMFESLKNIKENESHEDQGYLLEEFFREYVGPQSQIKFFGSSSLLDFFYKLYTSYKKKLTEPSRKQDMEFNEMLNRFYTMIENEYWNSHDIIYKDYKKYMELSFKNPFMAFSYEIIMLFKQLVRFLVVLSLLLVYFSLWNKFVYSMPIDSNPEWLQFEITIQVLIIFISLYGFTMMISSITLWENRRIKKNTFLKKLFMKVARRGG